MTLLFLLLETHEGLRRDVLVEANNLIKNELGSIDKYFYTKLLLVVALMAFVLYPVVRPDSVFTLHSIAGKLTYLLRIFLTMFLCGFFWLFVITRSYERHIYQNTSREIELQLNYGHNICRRKWLIYYTIVLLLTNVCKRATSCNRMLF